MRNISYGLRNTIALFVVFVILAGSGWAYIELVQNNQLKELQASEQKKKSTLKNDQSIASHYHEILKRDVKVKMSLDHFPKTISSKLYSYDVYEFLNKASQGEAYTNLNFTYLKTTHTKSYGIVDARVNGTGYYRDLYNLIRTIEYSSPIAKIKKLVISPYHGGKAKNSLNQVSFTFELEYYYDLTGKFKRKRLSVDHLSFSKLHNPFYPLIHAVPPNINDLPNVDKSKLVGIGNGLIYLVDQNGNVQELKIGAPVYMGHLDSIDLKHKTATFYLNEGGILDKVTLKIQ